MSNQLDETLVVFRSLVVVSIFIVQINNRLRRQRFELAALKETEIEREREFPLGIYAKQQQ